MKKTIAMLALFSAVTLLSVAAQAATNKGEEIFQAKCAMCHAIKGKGGTMGPDLTKISAKMKEKDLRAKLEDPKKSNPSSTMPSFKNLPKADMTALLGYLKTLK
ncbi:MAG: cytochrome C [Geobacteraceae bacterium GWC2_48_7]|nr:MAG: cytochrome C [Geobacteraceae bacterium GWC2_48_7]